MEPIASGESSHTWIGMFASHLLEPRHRASGVSSVRGTVITFADAAARAKARQADLQHEPASSRHVAMFREPAAASI